MLMRMITIGLVAALVLGPASLAQAGDREWATAGKILAGAVGLAILSDITSNQRPAYAYRGAPVYRRGRARCYRAPRVVYRPRRVWVEGYYVTREKKVWIRGYWEKRWIEPEYEEVWVETYHGGHWERRLVREGCWRKVRREGYYEYQTVRDWVPGYWTTR